MRGFRTAMVAAMAAAWVPTSGLAKGLHGDIGIYSRYLDLDLLVLTDQPVIQGGIYYDYKSCFAFAWGSHGVATETGGELDMGAYCSVQAGPVTVTGGAMRSFLVGTNDVTTVSIGLAAAGFDVTLERYLWPGNPNGTRIYGGYTLTPAKGLTVKPMLAYETGLGLPDVLAAGATGEFALTGHLSITALGLFPVAQGSGYDRKAQLMLGLKRTF